MGLNLESQKMSNQKLKPNWTMVKFGDVVRHIKDRVTDIENCGLTEYTRGEHFEPGNLHLIGRSKLGDGQHGSAFHMRFKPGDVLYVSRNPQLRKVAVADYEGICANTSYVLRANEEYLLQELLPFVMQTENFVEYTIQHKRGSTNFYLNFSDIEPYEFPLPPVDEQRRIAELIWTADSAILEYEKLYFSSEKMLTSILVDIFSESKWKQEKLEKHVVESLYGPRFSNTLYSDKGLVACLRTTDLLADGTIIYSTVPSVDLNPEDFKEHILQLGDFMISRSGTCGIASVFEGNSKITIPGAFLIRLRLKKSLNPMFLREYINSPIGQIRMGSLASGGVQKNIRGSLFLQEYVPLPDLNTQERIVEKIKTVRSSHKLIAEHIEKIKKVKSQLLQSQLG
jgi:type I restriction enzyme, S subunit